MAEPDKSIYGRKVFFINPNPNFEQQIITRLRCMEYEVYSISDYRRAKPILRKNADSICFCIIESQLSLKGWHNFIKSFEEERVFGPLNIGVIVHPISEDKLKNFVADIQLDAGIIKHEQDPEAFFREIIKSLDAKNAKGLRRYVRVDCLNEPQADLLWFKNSKLFKLKIIDISSAGLAAQLPTKHAGDVGINQIIEGVTLNLRNESVNVDIKVTAIKAAADFLLVVIMFELTTAPESINKIRKYIAESLQTKIQNMVRVSELDRDDYENFKF